MTNLTELELAVLRKLGDNSFADMPGDPIWSECINDDGKGDWIEPERLGGAVASLSKKGLAEATGSGRDAITRLTPAGVEAFEHHWADLSGW